MQTFDVDFSKQPFLAPPDFSVAGEPGEARLAAGDDYALVKSGPDVNSDEVELAVYGFSRDDEIHALGASTGLRRRW